MRIAVTPGEPSGIGPDLLIQLSQEPLDFELVVYADPTLLISRAKNLGLPLKIRLYDQSKPAASGKFELSVKPINLKSPVIPGILNSDNSGYVLETLSAAITDCQKKYCQALVTGPIHKGIINSSGVKFTGHTEFLADKTSTKKVVMMLATKDLKVALVTTHMPLSEVPRHITKDSLKETICILNSDLKNRFGIRRPKILVCGLNPHAGEDGYLGMEEIDIIKPCLNELRSEGVLLEGPLPADTIFTPKYLNNCDAILAMYHDQGLAAFKALTFGKGVNVTLGLPIIRTSVDHGTALDIVGSNKIDPSSFFESVQLAIKLANNKH